MTEGNMGNFRESSFYFVLDLDMYRFILFVILKYRSSQWSRILYESFERFVSWDLASYFHFQLCHNKALSFNRRMTLK